VLFFKKHFHVMQRKRFSDVARNRGGERGREKDKKSEELNI
jgi:hypothetical protein